MQPTPDIDIRSEEVQEILGTPPGWLVRWGTTVAFIFFLVLLWAAYWIRYPDTVGGTITVNSTEPPRKLYAPRPDYIARVLVRNEENVDSGQVLLAFRTKDNSGVDDVMRLEDAMNRVKQLDEASLLAFNPPRNVLLGDMQELFDDFIEKQSNYRQHRGSRVASNNSNERELITRIADLEKEIGQKNREKVRLQDHLEGLGEMFLKEQKLYQENRISYRKLQETQEDMRTVDRERQGVDSDIKSKRFEITMLKNQIRGERASTRQDNGRAWEEFLESYQKLEAAADEWRRLYLIISPMTGIVTFKKDEIADQQFVSKDAFLFSIVPTKMIATTGKMFVKVEGSGKVEPGQSVIVKFKSFPFYEYGAVIGKVKWKSRVPEDQKILVEIEFPDGLITTRGRPIEPSQEMAGEAQIITSDKRLIQKVFENFRRITS